MASTVQAAGGIVARRGDDGRTRVALVHRPRYDDWSLPKGKLQPGESWEQAALREVREETGVTPRLEEELPSVSYRDGKGREKVVRYWLMEPAAEQASAFEPGAEVDDLRWCTAEEAIDLLSYRRDREVLREALRRLGESGLSLPGG
jgi:8-oxo-dGTP diphosphatase